ncbi:MAG: cardiolipin synthase [Planctomycetales bacterium]|nr:cardiolipin synthase [Planctomycetales bacterium]
MFQLPDTVYTAWLFVGGLLNTALAVWASCHVVLTKRDNRSALGWVGIIWLTPFFGPLLYLMVGVNRIHRTARRLRKGPEKASPVPQEYCTDEDLHRELGPDYDRLSRLVQFVDKASSAPLLDGNRLTPLSKGDEAYAEMLAAIEGAKSSVSLQTYIFDNDEAGRMFVHALQVAKDRGVEVRVLIDDVGTRYTWPSIKGHLRGAGIKFDTFLPTVIPWKFQYTNLRNHRKILVVDGRLGFTGGMNIRQGCMESNPGKYPLHDLHFKVEGPVVNQLQETFADDWEFSTEERLTGETWFPRVEQIGTCLARGIGDGPDIEFDKIRLAILGAIGCASRSLHIVTPYFLPDQPLISALSVAAMRGVDVNIIIPQKNNLRLVQWACTAQLWQVLQRGCKVWLTPPPFDHTKLIVVDDVWSFVGSANWDARSLRLNFEFNVECYDRKLAAQLNEIVRNKISTSRQTSLEEVDSRSIPIRLRDGVARLALPYL